MRFIPVPTEFLSQDSTYGLAVARDMPFTLHPLKRLERLTLCDDLVLNFTFGQEYDGIYTLRSSISALTSLIKTTSSNAYLSFLHQ